MTLKEANARLQKINRGLFVEVKENENGQYYCIRYKDDRNALVRDVFNVLTDDGKPKSLEIDVIDQAARSIDWENVAKYKDPEDMFKDWVEKFDYAKRKAKLERQGFIMDMNRDRSSQWKKAFQEFKDSLTPEQVKAMKKEKERKDYYRGLANNGRLYFTGGNE